MSQYFNRKKSSCLSSVIVTILSLKKKLFYSWIISFASLLIPLSLFAHKTNNVARITMQHAITGKQSAPGRSGERYLPVILKLKSSDSELPDGVTVLHQRDRLVLASVAESSWKSIFDSPAIVRIESSVASVPEMDLARESCNFGSIGKSESNPAGLTGKGTVVGLYDVAIDFRHIALKDATGESRFKRWIKHSIENPTPQIVESPEEMFSSWTDNTDDYHGTHTSNILGGYAEGSPYNGVAVDADMIAVTGPLYDAYILNGCEEILDYAEEVDKPASISLSISNYIGPHDGTTLFNQYIGKIAEEAPVSIAVGNEARRAGAINGYRLAGGVLRSYITAGQKRTTLRGNVDIWNDSESSLSFRVIRYSEKDCTRSFDFSVNTNENSEGEWIIVSEDLASSYPMCEPKRLPADISGYIHIVAELNPENNRYNLTATYEVVPVAGADATDACFGFEITGNADDLVYVYTDGEFNLTSLNDATAVSGEADGAVNDMCLTDNVLSIGAYVSRDNCPLLTGEIEPSYGPLHEPAIFSSYGSKLPTGKILPDFCAPGSQIISAFSSAFIEHHPDKFHDRAAAALTADGKTYYYVSSCGTSMACPYVAGVAALIREALPALSAACVTDAIKKTIASPIANPSNPRWGNGVLDCEAALREAKAIAGLGYLPGNYNGSYYMKYNGKGTLYVSLRSGESAQLHIADLQGRTVASTSITGSGEIDMDYLANGIYVASLTTDSGATDAVKISL